MNLSPDLLVETERLTRSWAQHEAGWLRSYLVAGVEDPRINIQSILSRHFLLGVLAPDRWRGLKAEEYRFAGMMDWLQREAGQPDETELRAAILHALRNHSDNAEGLNIPRHVVQTFLALPRNVDGCVLPNYIEEFLLPPPPGFDRSRPFEPVLNTFCRLWNQLMEIHPPGLDFAGNSSAQIDEQRASPLLSLLEPACGSANDYRFLHAYGMARRFDYTGFDLCQANVENARALFPKVRFETANVFEIPAPAKAFDLCMVHDLFEHLSLAGLEQAVREICRVTRHGLCTGFFQMDEIPGHIVRPRDEYFWNMLSLNKMRELFARQGFQGQAIHIGSFLAHFTGSGQTHNPNAYTFILQAR